MTSEPTQVATRRYPVHAWIGIAILLGAEILLLGGNAFVATWFTPLMWTGYILAVDGLVFLMRGSSWLTSRRLEFPLLALASVGVWLLFEIYNLRLANWIYMGLPKSASSRALGYFWSFATIMPAVFETSDLLQSLLARMSAGRRRDRPGIRVGPAWLWCVLGAAMVAIPPATPSKVAAYLFGPVWIGFVLLLDPINERMGADSLRFQLKSGTWEPLVSLLVAGLACGFLWETWNYQAFRSEGAYWVYQVPQALRLFGWHFGKMPVLGLLGFPPFALELNAFYTLIRHVLNVNRLLA